MATLEIKNVAVEDAGKYKVTAKNELGESNATISLNFDSKSNTNQLFLFLLLLFFKIKLFNLGCSYKTKWQKLRVIDNLTILVWPKLIQ